VELETEQLLAYLTLEVNFINTQIMVLWVRVIELLRIAPRIITQYLDIFRSNFLRKKSIKTKGIFEIYLLSNFSKIKAFFSFYSSHLELIL
jgi:hypothetical protein